MRFPLTSGMRYMLLGTFLFSIGSLLIKMAGEHGVPTMEILFVRGVVGIMLCWMLVRRAGVGMLGNRRFTLFARGLFGFVSLFAEFYAIVHLPLADATAILFSHPMMVAVLAWVVIGERLGKRSVLGILACVGGVIVVCRPGFLFDVGKVLDPVAVMVALFGIVTISIAIITVRSLAKTEHPAVIVFYPPLLITLVGPLFSHDWVMPDAKQAAMLLGVAVLMNAGQYLMTRGYAVESAARISAVSCLEIVFAAFWGLSFLGEIPDGWTIGGGALIVLGVLVLGSGRDTSVPAAEA